MRSLEKHSIWIFYILFDIIHCHRSSLLYLLIYNACEICNFFALTSTESCRACHFTPVIQGAKCLESIIALLGIEQKSKSKRCKWGGKLSYKWQDEYQIKCVNTTCAQQYQMSLRNFICKNYWIVHNTCSYLHKVRKKEIATTYTPLMCCLRYSNI